MGVGESMQMKARVYGVLSQVDERHKQKVGWEMKDAARGNLGVETIREKRTLI